MKYLSNLLSVLLKSWLFYNALLLVFIPETSMFYIFLATSSVFVYIILILGIIFKTYAFDMFSKVDRDVICNQHDRPYTYGFIIFLILVLGAEWGMAFFHAVAFYGYRYRLNQYMRGR